MSSSRIAGLIHSTLEGMECRGEIVSVQHLDDLKSEIEAHHEAGIFDELFYKESLTVFDFEVQQKFPAVRSIIVTAAPQPQQWVGFWFKGRHHRFILPPTYSYGTDVAIEKTLAEILNSRGYCLWPASLPLKLLAARSGLAQYGKNNIAYVEGMGSFHRLKAFLSDLSATDGKWTKSRSMDQCEGCTACMKQCPTSAIGLKRFLIHAEKCLTFHNEREVEFPEWIEPSWHHCLIGCMRCQLACPVNELLFDWFEETEDFSAEETGLMMKCASRSEFPQQTIDKLERLYLWEDLELISRNLKALIRQHSV